MNRKLKTAKQLERYFKGAANHWRIAILIFVSRNEGASLDEIVEGVRGNVKTISGHTRGLVRAGLLNKKYKGRIVEHSLSPYGRKFFNFITTF